MWVDGQPSITRFQPSAVRASTILSWTPASDVLPPDGLLPSGLSWTCSSMPPISVLESGSSAGCFGSPGPLPDLNRSGDIPAVGAQQPDDVLLDEAGLLREAGEHPALGDQFPEEVLPPSPFVNVRLPP